MLWHYTTGAHLEKILLAGHLRLTPKKPERGQVPGVWFTASDEWEPTAAKRMTLRDPISGAESDIGCTTFELLYDLMGIARIGVEDDPWIYLTFDQYREMCSADWAAHLVRAHDMIARAVGRRGGKHGPDWWRVCLCEVPESAFVRIEIYTGTKWEAYVRSNSVR